MKKVHLLFAGAFAALAIVACSDDELETETNTGTDTETEEGETGDENTGDENTGDNEEAPQAYITLSAAELQFARTGGEATVTVDANYDWDCEYDSDWFTVVADTNARTITVTCDANETGEAREGTVTVTAGDGEENVAEATLAITQLAFAPESLVLEYTIDEDGTEIQLPLGEKDYDENKYDIDCTVDWGDGSEVETVNSSWPSHKYSAGTYTVTINGTVELLCCFDSLQNRTDIDGVECLTAVKQWGDLGLKSMSYAFCDCKNLTSLPDGPGPFSDVTSFYGAFSYCESLTAVPEDMFSGCTAAEDFGWVFGYCTNLTSAPSFKGLSNATSFYAAFYRCYFMVTVPEDMFSGCTAAESFGWAFCCCTELTSVPSFKGLSNATDFYAAFSDCYSLATVPEDMFSGCTAAEDFEFVFEYCSSLTSAPSFKGLSNVTSFYAAFWGCYPMATLPEDMFSGCTATEDFGAIFGETSLTSVSENLFADCPLVESFEEVFSECESLVTVPVGIFDNNTLVTDFSWAFTLCSKLAGESPYTVIGGNNVHLYERANYPESFTKPTIYSVCFAGCTFSDMDSIPSTWGGNGASPSSITPQSLNAPSPEGFGPSRLGPQRAAATPQGPAARLHRDTATPQGPAARPLPTRK